MHKGRDQWNESQSNVYKALKQVLESQPPKMNMVEPINVVVCALRAGCGAPLLGALLQYIPEAGAAGTSMDGEGGHCGGGGKAVYSEVDLFWEACLLGKGSGFEVPGVDWGLASEAAVEEDWVFMLAEEGLFAMADVVRIGTGRLSEVLFEFAMPESVTVLLLDASMGVRPPLGF